MAPKLIQDRDVKAALVQFFEDTNAAACRSDVAAATALNAMLSQENASRMVDGVVFNVSLELNARAEELVQRLCRSIGSVAGGEGHISKALWREAADRLKQGLSSNESAESFLNHVIASTSASRRYITGNRLLVLKPGIDHFELANVAIATGRWTSDELNALKSDAQWVVEEREPGVHLSSDGRHSLPVAPVNWVIRIAAAKENLPEEAAWLAGVLTSLLRLAAGRTLGPFGANQGKVEPHPFRHPPMDSYGITAEDTSISTGGFSLPPQYQISAETITFCETPEMKIIVGHIFSPARRSVGERAAQCLGWLARGRQSEDRADRFLYFFTALEALLSSDDKTAPVVQTIARNASSILTNDPQARADNAQIIKRLYTSRSALVHTGARGVTRREANTIEYIADLVCWRILDQVDLSSSVVSFQEALSKASYGLPWGDENVHRLSSASEPELAEVEASDEERAEERE